MPKAAKIKSSKRTKKQIKEEPVNETELIVEEPENTTTEVVEEKTSKRRGVLTSDELLVEFDQLVTFIETECQNQRDNGNTKGTKFLRSCNKRIKNLKSRTTRTLRQKRKGKRKSTNTVSGFMKPVGISKEMSKFAGWDTKELKSRIDVTRNLCAYIKDNDLQKPEDKRKIIPDKKIRKLLRMEPGDELTYYQLQQKIQCHFEKVEKKV